MPNFIEDTTEKETVLAKTSMLKVAGINSNMLQDAGVMARFQEVVNYFTQFEDGILHARRVVAGKPEDQRLQILFEYVQAKQQMEQVRNELLEIEEQRAQKQKEFDRLESIISSLESS